MTCVHHLQSRYLMTFTLNFCLQSSCAFADMANDTADLTLSAAETVVSFLSAHIAGLREEAAAASLAPLPNGDPFK